jgi:hypothetical protein
VILQMSELEREQASVERVDAQRPYEIACGRRNARQAATGHDGNRQSATSIRGGPCRGLM